MCVKSYTSTQHLFPLGTQNLESSSSSECSNLFFRTMNRVPVSSLASLVYDFISCGCWSQHISLCYYWKSPRFVLTDSLPKVFKRPTGLSADKKFPISNVHFPLKCSWRKQCPSSLCCYLGVKALARKWEFLGSIHAASLTTILDSEEDEQEGNGESPPFRLKLRPCSERRVRVQDKEKAAEAKDRVKQRCVSLSQLLKVSWVLLTHFCSKQFLDKNQHWLGNNYQKPSVNAYSSLCLLPSISHQCHTFAILSNRDTTSTVEVMNAPLPFCSPSEHLGHSPGSLKLLM